VAGPGVTGARRRRAAEDLQGRGAGTRGAEHDLGALAAVGHDQGRLEDELLDRMRARAVHRARRRQRQLDVRRSGEDHRVADAVVAEVGERTRPELDLPEVRLGVRGGAAVVGEERMRGPAVGARGGGGTARGGRARGRRAESQSRSRCQG
jgi:hypothetical protein